jgi:hypothetical protein
MPAGPPLDGGDCCRRGVFDVDERPNARTVANDGELALADQLDLAAGWSRAIEVPGP